MTQLQFAELAGIRGRGYAEIFQVSTQMKACEGFFEPIDISIDKLTVEEGDEVEFSGVVYDEEGTESRQTFTVVVSNEPGKEGRAIQFRSKGDPFDKKST